MFGKPAAATGGFGGFGNTVGGGAGAGTPATTSLFGGPLTTTPSTGFGGQQPSNRPPSLSIAGGGNTAMTASAPNTAAQQQQGGGLFGTGNSGFNQQNTNTNTGFGTSTLNAAANTTTGSAFGGGAFGAGQQQQQQQQQQPGGLFGGNSAFKPANAPGSTSLFGGGGGGAAGTTTTGLFGQQQGGGGLFGANNNQQQQQQGGLFGASNTFGMQQQQQPQFQPSFGQQQQQQQMMMQQQPPQAIDHVKSIAACWDPKNPACHFKFYFYNLVHPSEVHLYQPAPGEDRGLYEQAKADNPEPSCMVPVLAVGFDGLKTRLEMQEDQLKIHREKIEEFKTRLSRVEQTHTIETVIKIERYRNKQRQISHRVLQLMKSVQILRNKGYSLRAEEEALMTRLTSMERELAKPSVFRGRINEIHAQVQQLKDANRLGAYGSGGNGGDEGFVLADPQALQPVVQTLEWMSKGLGELTNVVKEDDDNLDTIERGYQRVLS